MMSGISGASTRTTLEARHRVLVTGASGYVGGHVLTALLARGFRVRALVRSAAQSLPVGVERVRGDVTQRTTLYGACTECFAVVHLVGAINEAHGSFEKIHVEGTRNMVEEARADGAARFIYLGGLGQRAGAPARYHRTKYEAGELVRTSGMEGYVFPASVIFGAEDQFLNLFVRFARNLWNPFYPPWPIMPLIGGGASLLQPVWVDDVAEVLARACEPGFRDTFPPGQYELGGPESLTLQQIMRIACRIAGRERVFVSLPWSVAHALAWLMERMPEPLLTRDQVLMLQEDGRAKKNMTPALLGRAPCRMWDYAQAQFGVS